MSCLQAKSVSLSLGGNEVLSEVSIDVAPGKLHVVVGPNGAGKSSLVKLLSGEYVADQGHVSFEDRALAACSPQSIAQRLAILPQRSTLNFAFSAHEVVALGRYPHSSGEERDQQIVAESLESVGASALRDRLYTTLSGGEQQRIHLARVLAQIWDQQGPNSRYLLLDEPTAALDLAHQHLILQVSAIMSKQGVGVLSVLHDLNLASQYADIVTLLDRGRVVMQGAPELVLSEENIREVYGIEVDVIRHPTQDRFLIIDR